MARPNAVTLSLRRDRKPGDLVFAILFLALAVFLLGNLGGQTTWVARTKLFAQPAFWPTVSLIGMVLFSLAHVAVSLRARRSDGRWREVAFWVRALEYVGWFMIYVVMVPLFGYLLSTLLLMVALTLRSGYRGSRPLWWSAVAAVTVVLVFKTMLQVKVPGGQLYELLPSGLRAFMLTYF